MKPVVTPAMMAAVDAAAPEPIEELIDRAARAVARSAISIMGGTYGRRVVVLAGPGNNGADGRVAAEHLRRRGVRCEVVDVDDAPDRLPAADLVIDAAFGTGLRRPFHAPEVVPGTTVLAVDIPSGIDGDHGAERGRALAADHTITFAALKPGVLFEPGRARAGAVHVADIGLAIPDVDVHLVEDADIAELITEPPPEQHKWRAGVRLIGGSAGMTGAIWLAARAAQRSGAGIVEVAAPGGAGGAGPVEAVGIDVPAQGWGSVAATSLDRRVRALLVGPGLGPSEVDDREAVVEADVPVVLDADMLTADLPDLLAARSAPTVLTPHDGEWARLGGADDVNRIDATRAFAVEHDVIVVRKGATTVIAAPDGRVRIVTSGTAALATAGTGDVLAGMIVGLIGRGLDPFDAASAAAHVHGRIGAMLGPGLVAGDLVDRLPAALSMRDSQR